MSADRRSRDAWRTYLLSCLPEWIFMAVAAVVLYRLGFLPGWTASLVVVVRVVYSISMFPRVRRYYTSEPAAQSTIGATGMTISALEPEGTVRVRGEVWRASALEAGGHIPEGVAVRVRSIEGLQLLVERVDR